MGPTRIELTREHPVAVLEVRNDNPDPTLVQIERMSWGQDGGTDRYAATSLLIGTPPVFELPAGATQTVRVAFRNWQQLTAEKAFRIYVREVPRVSGRASSGLQFALRVGVPVFANPPGAASHLQWVLETIAGGQLALSARNTGGRWAHIVRLEVRAAGSGPVLWHSNEAGYVVAGGERLWTGVALPAVRSGQQVEVLAVTDAGDLRDTVTLPP
ncbi:MAG: putative pili assembly chaperone transrane protein [Gammaproteobacteria bacterium]|nr:putative pili assembly chaperone transrane protein [Gammaproteobacteria bacterium]